MAVVILMSAIEFSGIFERWIHQESHGEEKPHDDDDDDEILIKT